MKYPIFLFFLLLITIQCVGQCATEVEAARYISANKIKAVINSRGGLFHLSGTGGNGFAVPYVFGEEEVNSVFTAGLWIGGVDPAGNLKVAASTYGWNRGNYDYFSGPLDEVLGTTLDSTCVAFTNVWRVTRSEINIFLEDYEDNGQLDQPIPRSILVWPGRGNKDAGYEYQSPTREIYLPDQELAPFFDGNDNNIYEPRLGEYPIIGEDFQEVIPDELLWCVFNDAGDFHASSGGDPIQAEVHLTAWAFSCADNDLLNETIFTRHKIINRAIETLDSTSIGMWIDGDLGCFNDDYFGCDTTLNTVYFYNADNLDGQGESTRCANTITYGENPPVQAITFLNQPMTTLTYHNNRVVGNPPVGTTAPTQPIEYYRYLTGSWQDGSLLRFGDDGHLDGAPKSHAFSSNPNDTTGWSMYQWNSDPNLDRAVIPSVNNIRLDPGASITLDIAYSFHREEGSDHLQNVNYALDRIPELQEIYDQKFITECARVEVCEEDCVYPGDGNQDGITDELDILALGIGIGKMDTGIERPHATHIWNAQNAPNWSQELMNGANFKHLDANGDGQLNKADLAVILHNLEKENDAERFSKRSPILEDASIKLKLLLNRNSVNYDANSSFSRVISVDIILEMDSTTDGIHGLSGRLHFPAYYAGLGEGGATGFTRNYFLDLFNENTYENEDISVANLQHDKGEIDFILSRTDLQNVKEQGKIGNFRVSIKSDFYTLREDGILPVKFQLKNLTVINANEEVLPISSNVATVEVYNVPIVTIGEEEKEPDFPDDEIQESLSIYPNPTDGTINIRVPTDFQEQVLLLDIYDASGKKCWQIRQSAAPHTTLQLPATLENGIYFLKAISQEGKQLTKSFLLHKN